MNPREKGERVACNIGEKGGEDFVIFSGKLFFAFFVLFEFLISCWNIFREVMCFMQEQREKKLSCFWVIEIAIEFMRENKGKIIYSDPNFEFPKLHQN